MTEEDYDADQLALRMERFTNRFGVNEDLKRLAFAVVGWHRTLVQSFTSGFILQLVKKMAENYREKRFDGRDELACAVCDAMWSAVEKKYELGQGEDVSLPMI